jgi:serine/threonine protein kinase
MSNFPQPGEIFSKRYELLEVLGTGGISTVFKAVQVESKRKIALKIMHPKLNEDGDFTKRFIAEARVLNQLKHPNIVSIYHIGVADTGLPYIAMELVRGRNLRQLLKEDGALPALRAVHIAKQIAEALSYVHSHNIIHRDLKPENFIILDQPAADSVKLIDFGFARITNGSQNSTSTGTVLGSIEYMSPEQCQGRVVDQRTDIYALGVCFFQMLTNRKPFDAENAVGLMYQHNTAAVPPIIANEVDRFDPEMNKLIAKAMAKSPESRFQTMAEFSAALSLLEERLEHAPMSMPPAAVPPNSSSKNILFVLAMSGIFIIVLSSIAIAGLVKHNQLSKLSVARADIDNPGIGNGKNEINQEVAMDIIRKSFSGIPNYVDEPIGRLSRRQAAALLNKLQAYANNPNSDPAAKCIFLIEISKLTESSKSSQLDIQQALKLAQIADRQQRKHSSKELLIACTAAYIEQCLAHNAALQEADRYCDLQLKSIPKTRTEDHASTSYFRILHPYSEAEFLILKAKLQKALGHYAESEKLTSEIAEILRSAVNYSSIYPICAFLSLQAGDAQLKKTLSDAALSSDKIVILATACYDSKREEIGDYAMDLLGSHLLNSVFYSSKNFGEAQIRHINNIVKREGVHSKKGRALAEDLEKYIQYRGKSEVTGYDRFDQDFQSRLIVLLMRLDLSSTAHDLIDCADEKSMGISKEQIASCQEQLEPYASDKYIQRWIHTLKVARKVQ